MCQGAGKNIDTSREGRPGHAELINILADTVAQNPRTIFIACHLANCSHDLEILGRILDRFRNLYADSTSRLKEVGTVPRYARAFFEKYQDRLLFGSDLGYDPATTLDFAGKLYRGNLQDIRIGDEHIYEHGLFKYHWPLYGLELTEIILKKLYRENALKLTTLG